MDIISKQDAKNKGIKKYFTGDPCNYGHISERYVSGQCVECVVLRSIKRRTEKPEQVKAAIDNWNKKNAERVKETSRAYTEKHKEERNKTSKAWRESNPERNRYLTRKARGLPDPEYPTPDSKICERCNKLESKMVNGEPQALSLDHDHTTNKFRGWICDNCNTGMGKLGDTSKDCFEAACYILDSEPDIQACY